MAPNDPNDPTNHREAPEDMQKSDKTDPNIAEQLVRQFLDAKLSDGTTGVEFYNQAKSDRCAQAVVALKEYYADRSEWSYPEAKKALEGIEQRYFYRELIRMGAAIESKRKALRAVIVREFELPEDLSGLDDEIATLEFDSLTRYVSNRPMRSDFVARVFPQSTLARNDVLAQIRSVLGTSVRFSPEQEHCLARLALSPYVREDDLSAALALFSTLEEKQAIIKYFLPTTSLGELVSLGVISKKDAQKAIRHIIEHGHFDTFQLTDTDLPDVIDQINAHDIIIPTDLFPESVVDAILGSQGRQVISRGIEEVHRSIEDDFKKGNELHLLPDAEGRLLPSFIAKLREAGIPHADLFQAGNLIQGNVRDEDGNITPFCLAISSIQDDPEENRRNKGRWTPISMRSILTQGSNTIDKNWRAKTDNSQFSYFSLFSLLKKAHDQAQQGGSVKLITQEQLDEQVRTGDLSENVLRSDLISIGALNAALDVIDPNGSKHPIQNGSTIQMWKPGDENFWVFKVKSVGGRGGDTIAVSGDGNNEDIHTLSQFLDIFESQKCTRLPKMDTAEEFLHALREHSGKDSWKGIVFDAKRWFIPEDKLSDKDYPSITQFSGYQETISISNGTDPMYGGWALGEWEEEEIKEGGKVVKRVGKYREGAKHYQGGWNALFAQMLQIGGTPVVKPTPIEPLEGKDAHVHMHKGWFKSYLWHPSIHDMMAGAKWLVDFIKHKLEHGSKLEAAKFQLALGKRLGFNEAMMRELRGKVHENTRKLMEELINELSGLPAGERSTEVAHMLQTKWTHDYEIQAATIAMLKKHGRLYVGDALKPLEGSFLFWERITWEKYNAKNPGPKLRLMIERNKDRKVPLREELLIQSYLQWLGSKDGGYGVDWSLWGQIRDGWRDGVNGEAESGEKQAAMLDGLDQRLFIMKDKLKWWEVASGIGVMRKVWAKGGGPHGGHLMHLPAVYLTLSHLPSTFHTDQTNKLYNEFKSDAHPYPALAFLRSEAHADLFGRVVGKLCKGDAAMEAAYKKVVDARKKRNLSDVIPAIETFWLKYGVKLHKQLVMSQDPKILFLAKEWDEDCKAYVEHMSGFTYNLPFNKDEINENAYDYTHSAWTWNATEFLQKNVQLNQTSGVLAKDPATKMAWGSFIDAVKDLKNTRVSDNPEKNRAFQLDRFTEYYKALNTILAEIPSEKFAKISTQPYMKQLIDMHFPPPKTQQKETFGTPQYQQEVRLAFEAFMSGSPVTVEQVTGTVAMSAEDLVARHGKPDPEST